jgi:hypothetical protein
MIIDQNPKPQPNNLGLLPLPFWISKKSRTILLNINVAPLGHIAIFPSNIFYLTGGRDKFGFVVKVAISTQLNPIPNL